eukprot:3529377-Karenia_brevis.AAC.1
MVTCIACGHGEKKEIEQEPQFKFEDCPHNELDRHGSNNATVMFHCKQCCTHIDARDRTVAQKLEKVSTEMTVASTEQQRLAA